MQAKKEINKQLAVVPAEALEQRTTIDPNVLEQVLIKGDLSGLSTPERVSYYKAVCESVGLNPLTRPFEYLTFQGKLTLYARKAGSEQLRLIQHISLQITSSGQVADGYVVNVRATMPDGRFDEDTGVVFVGNLKGEAYANAVLKAVTKAKRRVTLSICGLGMLDELEVETLRGAVVGEPEQHADLDVEINELSKALLEVGMSKGELHAFFTEVTGKSTREGVTTDEKRKFIAECKSELIRLSEVVDEDDANNPFAGDAK